MKKNSFISIILCLLLIFCTFPVGVFAASTDIVTFADANMKALLISQGVDENGDGQISKGELADLSYLSISYSDIENLGGLENAVNLTTLDISGNSDLNNITALASMPQLTSLTANDDKISSITALSGLTDLSYLDLDDNKIIDISSLSKLTNLDYLSLDNNVISDVSPLSGLVNLESLYLDDNIITDISSLKTLTKLTTFSASGDTDIPLKEIEALVTASLGQSSLTLNVNMNALLTYITSPSELYTDPALWSSSNVNVATVAADGTVTAKGIGTATITGQTTDGDDLAHCTIKVVAPDTSPVTKVDSMPQIIGDGGQNAGEAADHGTGSAALYSNGDLWGWGSSYTNTSPHKVMGNVKKYIGDTVYNNTGDSVQTYFNAITTDDSFWAWGEKNNFSSTDPQKLIDNVASYDGNYVLAKNGTLYDWSTTPSPTIVTTNVARLVDTEDDSSLGGMGSNTYAIKTDNSLWDLGASSDDTGEDTNTPVQITDNVLTVDMGYAIKTDHTLWSLNPSYDTENITYTPTQVTGISNVASIADGSDGLFITTDNSLWSLGESMDTSGNTTYAPVKILDNVSKAFLDSALKTDGTLWDLGMSFAGVATSYNPVKMMDGVSDIEYEDSSINSSAIGMMPNVYAIKSDKTLWDLQMGLNIDITTDNASITYSPVLVFSNVAKFMNDCVITTDNSLYDLQVVESAPVINTNDYSYTPDTSYSPALVLSSVANVIPSSADVWYIQRTDGTVWQWRGPQSQTPVNDSLYIPTKVSLPVNLSSYILGVTNNSICNQPVAILFSGTATLNGVNFISGSVVSAAGNYTLVVTDSTGSSTIVFSLVKLGDVSSDGKITSADALMVLKAAAGKITLNASQIQAADVNNSGTITSADALEILKYAAGRITSFS